MLAEHDLQAGAIGRAVFAHPGFDVPAWLEFDHEARTLAAVIYLGEGLERQFIDARARTRQLAIDSALPATCNRVVSLTLPVGGPGTDLPTIVYPHGGPSGRVLRDYNPVVELILFENQPHSYRGEADRIELFERLGLFFAQHLSLPPDDGPNVGDTKPAPEGPARN